MAYAWTNTLETGNKLIDDQHKTLIKAINDLMEACSKGAGRDNLLKTCKFMIDYTDKHFADEQELQMKYKYPDRVNHMKLHVEFKKVALGIMSELEEKGPSVALVAKVNTTIAQWLTAHIKKEDVKVAAHIKSCENK